MTSSVKAYGYKIASAKMPGGYINSNNEYISDGLLLLDAFLAFTDGHYVLAIKDNGIIKMVQVSGTLFLNMTSF